MRLCTLILIAILAFFPGHWASAQNVSATAAAETDTAVEQRMKGVQDSLLNRFSLPSYRPNYILLAAYNSSPNTEPFEALQPDLDMDRVEVKFQLSLQFDIWREMFHQNIDLYAAYTQLSLWQAYNSESAPFRETNFEPELGFIFRPGIDLLGLKNRQVRVGIVHQSNGRAEPLSRSWNRIFSTIALDRGNFATLLRTWYRLPEDDEEDNNPDISKFLGFFEWYAFYKWDKQTYGIMVRNNLRNRDNRGAVQLDWSYPIGDRSKLYIQYFNGYGESLIDYNDFTNRIGMGFMLTDWL